MIKPPTPVDELLRLEALRNLKILDTDPEERFDRVTRLARKLFGVPMALVSLIDANRQWFKSKQGLCATETPREISFCGHAILSDEPLVVADALADPRFADNPLVTEDPNIRFYAGCPVSGPGGQKVGTLCVIDTKPRGMTAEELSLLKDLAEMVEDELVVADFLMIDPTTGLSNRPGFIQIADHLLAMCTRNEMPASLLLLNQKNESTERAAIEATQLMLATFRESDVIGRLADGIFAVMLVGAQHDNLKEIGNRFYAQIDARNGKKGQGDSIDIDIDIYSIRYEPKLHSTAEELVQRAETLLDEAGKKPAENLAKTA